MSDETKPGEKYGWFIADEVQRFASNSADTLYVEKSAYDALKKERDELLESNNNCISRGLHEIRMRACEQDNDRLKAENDKLKRTLSTCLGAFEVIEISPNYFNLDGLKKIINEARECLESLK